MSALRVYTDGGCQPNPGRGGWAFVVMQDGEEVHSDCGGEPVTTNQRMELTAALMALRWLASNAEPGARLFSDSMYTVKGCNHWRHGWRRKGWRRGRVAELANADLWRDLDEALSAYPLTLEWVRGHNGNAGNVRADALALAGRERMAAGHFAPKPACRQGDFVATTVRLSR
jgi:ribonuclease HI